MFFRRSAHDARNISLRTSSANATRSAQSGSALDIEANLFVGSSGCGSVGTDELAQRGVYGVRGVYGALGLRRLPSAIARGATSTTRLRSIACKVGLVVALLGLAPAFALAQDKPSKEDLSRYRELIGKALQEYSLGHWPEARVFFSDAHALWPNARTLRGLGMTCYEARSYVEAIDFLERALKDKTQPLTPKLASESQSILSQAKRFVATARFFITPDAAQLTIDDRPVHYNDDGVVLLDPGDHRLQAWSSGYRTEERTINAEAGSELRVRIELEPNRPVQSSLPVAEDPQELQLSSASAPVSPQEASEPRLTLARQDPTVAGALSAVGLAAIVTGWVFYALRDDVRLELWEYALTQAQSGVVSFEQSKVRDYQMRGGVALASAGVGAVALSLAQYFYLPDDDAVPAWAWVASGAGAALALGAAGLALFGKHCELTDPWAYCQSTMSDTYFAPLLAIHAVPLLSLPFFYLARGRVASEVRDMAVRLDWRQSGSGGFTLNVSGRF